MMTKKISFSDTLFFLGIFFIPFNSYEGIPLLGEYSRDSCTIFFILASVLVFFKAGLKNRFDIPIRNPIFQILILFFGWLLLTVTFNFFDVWGYYFKGTSGINRFIRQYFALLLSGAVFLLAYHNILSKYSLIDILIKIRKVILVCFIITSAYTFLEILILKFNMFGLENLFYAFNYFPFTEATLDHINLRISSVTFEPPAYATYLITIAGWMFSYIITSKGLKKFIPALLVILFAIFSGSRAAILIVLLQFLIFYGLLIKKTKYFKLFLKIIQYVVVIGSIILLFKGNQVYEYLYEKTTSFAIDDDVHSISNKSRFGIQYTSGIIFLENPVIGVGFGQQPFEAKNKYPKWATDNNWEFRLKYLNEEHKSFAPGYNIYLRILAETGIIGFVIFVMLLISALYVCFKLIKLDNTNSILAIIIFVSLFGFILNWFKSDTFRIFGFWINLALLFKLMQTVKINFGDNQ